jgi:predicted metalloprotease with PDZ domain
VFTINVDVPAGATMVKAEYQFLSPLEKAQGRVVVTPEIIGLQWSSVLLYPAGHNAAQITYAPSLKVPAGWKFGSALEVASENGSTTTFKPTDLETLMDSPLFAGKYYKQFDLDPGAKIPVRLNVVADADYMLEITPEILAKHRALVQQAYKLYGSQHYAHYDFQLALSDRFSGIGLEHHQSSENSAAVEYLTDNKRQGSDLLPHEYTHSWNGKFRRGADLITPNYNVPMQDSLLWVYEGQTQYWGYVLSARSGLKKADDVRDTIAAIAAAYDNRKGREWRALEDTTMQPIISRRSPQPWTSWQRAEDYYTEGQLVWLDADTLIREKTGGRKSLDDFARAFFGVETGRVRPLGYTFGDVVKTLNGVVANDWASFLRERLDNNDKAPLDGITRGGYELVYTDKPVDNPNARDAGGADFTYSLGLRVGKDMKIADVLWNSPAFNAGLASSMTVVAVNGMSATPDGLKRAIVANQKTNTPVVLVVNDLDHLSTVTIDYRGGLKYPHLKRIEGKPALLDQILAPRK